MSETKTTETTARETLELELLAIRCQLGEPAALDALVERWHEPLWRFALGLAGDPVLAEEVLQDGWLRIFRGLPKLRDPSRLRAWLLSIVRRTFMDRLRGRYTLARSETEPLEGEVPDPDPRDHFAWEDSEALRAALAELSPPDRETIVLFYLQELDLREVGEVLDIPVGTVKSRLHRSRRLLRSRLESRGVTR